MSANKTYIYGKHAVTEALLHAPKTLNKVYFNTSFEDGRIKELVHKNSIAQVVVQTKDLPGETEEEVHQGVVASLSLDLLLKPFDEFKTNFEVNADSCLILLGELQDVQNVGAVIRSAAAFGVGAVLIPEHNQVQFTGTVVKVSAGMAFRIPLVTVPNVNSAVRDLQKLGFWVYGLDGESKKLVTKEVFDAPTLFILGNEATGIRQKTLELCDVVLSIPTNPQCESLNAATSAAVAMYAWSAQHPKALKPKAK